MVQLGFFNFIIIILYLIFFISLCFLSQHELFSYKEDDSCKPDVNKSIIYEHYNDVSVTEADFDFFEDMFAIVQIQKTSGDEFESHIWRNLEINPFENSEWIPACKYEPYNKAYRCYKNSGNKPIIWDRHSAKFCDIHADYTETLNCLMLEYNNRLQQLKKRLMKGIIHVMAFLRDPLHRYISEYEKIKTG